MSSWVGSVFSEPMISMLPRFFSWYYLKCWTGSNVSRASGEEETPRIFIPKNDNWNTPDAIGVSMLYAIHWTVLSRAKPKMKLEMEVSSLPSSSFTDDDSCWNGESFSENRIHGWWIFPHGCAKTANVRIKWSWCTEIQLWLEQRSGFTCWTADMTFLDRMKFCSYSLSSFEWSADMITTLAKNSCVKCLKHD